ncbi:MAG: AMP-binding protein [Haloechinothrix sp.]
MTTTGNVSELASAAARDWPNSIALIDSSSGLTLTWGQVDDAVNAAAAGLAAAGVAPGDRVAVRLATSAAFAVTLFGVLRAGGIVVPVSPQAPSDELHRLLDHSGARILVTGEPGETGLPADGVTALPPTPLPGEEGFADAAGSVVAPIRGGADIAVLSYTTAMPGRSRGVMLSHRALLANVDQLGRLDPPPVTHTDRLLVAIPLFHVYGLGPGLLQAAAFGASAVLAERFDARRALTECTRHGVSVVLGVPTMYTEFAALPAAELAEGLAGVRMLTSGAAPLHPKVLGAISDATGLGVFEGYGLTETAPVLTSTLVTGYPKPGSVGRPIPGVELRLVDAEGGEPAGERSVPLDSDDPDDLFEEDSGATGLVCVRGPNLFSGYWPDGAEGPDADGWFRTSDVGYLDTDGDLHLVDRANDLIIVNGFNVYPHEVEAVIGELPGVAEVAVVGVIDDRSGEAVRAVVVPKPGVALSEHQIVEHCATKLARYKIPRTVQFADELPHTVTGKLRRTSLR